MKGEVRRRETKAGAARIGRQALIAMLFVMLVFTMVPLLAPGTGSAHAATNLQWPTPGYRHITDGRYFSSSHGGIDISGDGITAANIYSPHKGKVTKVFRCGKKHYGSFGDCNGFGTGVVIKGTDGRIYHFAHMLGGSIPTKVYVGATVERGQIIGKVGTTGNSTGPHLHYAISSKGDKYYENLVNPLSSSFSYNYDKPSFNQYPFGYVTKCSTGSGTLTVEGWAYDPDNTGKTINVRVYFQKPKKKKTDKAEYQYIGQGAANLKNKTGTNANDKYECGSKHAFKFTLNTTKFGKGNKSIYITGVNIDKNGKTAGGNAFLCDGGKAVTFKEVTNYKVTTKEASMITNTGAFINGTFTPAGSTPEWGYYLGVNESDMDQHKYTVGTSATSSNDMSAYTAYYKKLLPGVTYFCRVYAKLGGKEVKASNYVKFTTTANKPEIPDLKVDSKSEEIGIGDAPVFRWKPEGLADYYKINIYDENERLVSTVDKIRGGLASAEAIHRAGKYTARIEAYNSVGTKGQSEPVEFVVHPNVVVTFKDADSFVDVDPATYEPAVLGTSEVRWGHDADLPSKPSHKGYTFKGWSGESKAVTEDTTVKAEYEKNSYTVKFMDSETGASLGQETVDYYESANPPDFTPQDGYVKLGHNGWDKDYTCITEDTTLYTCSGWYDDNLPIRATITNAVREYDTASSEDEGYTVTVKLQNWNQGTTKGRAVVALKTAEGKLLTSTESAAFNIKSSATKEIEVFVPYENAALIAEVFVVGQYKDAVPISASAEFTIDQSNTMTSWSEEQPPAGAANVESKVEYRYSDKQTTTSYSTSLAGYTQSGSSWVKQSSGTIDYVPSFPSGFYKSSAYYTKYNGVKPKTASETATAKTTVSTSTKGYIYWHWCRGATSGPSNRLVSDCKEGSYTHWHSFWQTTPISFDSSAKSFYRNYPTVCKDSYWWMSTYAGKSNQLAIKTCTYNTYKKQFTYYKWTDWSAWSTTPVTANDNRKVQTRTVYRYQAAGAMDEDTSGTLRTVTGSVDSSFSGMEASLFIYKVNEASDFTNEYVDQTVIGPDGDYSFTFKLREEPTEETGDFTIALGIEGTTTPIFLDPKDETQCSPAIAAPIKEYTVKFVDDDNTVLSEQTVPEHGNAELPDESQLQKEGYTFTKWSNTNMNVTEDRTIQAEYKKNTYTVVFVDWQAKTVSMDKFEYGAKLVAPQPAEPEEGQTVEWDKIADGVTEVTQDLIVTTRYKDKELNVTILDDEGKVEEEKTVTYGMAVDLPEVQSTEEKEFAGWADISSSEPEGLEDTIMTTNAILSPVYTYNETVADPTADLAQGEYDEAQTVKLSCETPGADIYYTLDGSDPTALNSKLYTGPIQIDGPVELKFYASKFEMNDSNVQTRLYAVNYDDAITKYMLEEELPEEVKANESAYHVQYRTGYRYKESQAVKTLAEGAALEAAGWTRDTEAEPVYDSFSAWSDTMPADAEEYINLDVETEPVYTTADQFKYSHYVYDDGVTKYAPAEVDGFECTYEELGPLDEPLYSSGRDENGVRYYTYDGQRWYNQTEITGQVQTGTKYRWRAQQVNYTKWGDWTLEKPAGDATEYETSEVAYYDRPDYHIVTVHYADETWSYLVEAGSLANIDIPNELGEDNTAYAFDAKGVYTDQNYTNGWNLETDTVTGPTELFVKTETKSFDVYFISDDLEIASAEEEEIGTYDNLDDYAIAKRSVAYGEAAEAPEAPARDGYIFVGWDSDAYKEVKDDLVIRTKYVPEDEYATVALDNNTLELFKGNAADLTAKIEPVTKSDTELTWTSSDENVAVVSDEGTVTGMGAGTADITVKVNETGETAVCTVTVKVDNSEDLVLIKNDKLKVDAEGFLRGAKGNKDTVADILLYFDNANLNVVNMNDEAVAEDDLFGTGYKVQLLVDGVVKDVMEAVVTGDFTGDGSINNKDVAQLLRHLMDKVTPTDAQIRAADVNGNGLVDARDAVLTLRVIVGKDALD